MRFIDIGYVGAEYSVSLDRALFESRCLGSDDTLCIYSRDSPTISMGMGGSMDDVIGDIPVVRRMSGGGTIYSDEWQLTYTAVVGRSDVPSGKEDSFRYICKGLINALESMGLSPAFKPVNDILVDGRKISGSAQYRNSDVLLQHGSLILRVPDDAHLAGDVEHRLIGIEDVLGRIPDRCVLIESIRKGFSEVFGDMTDSGLTEREISRIAEIMKYDRSHGHA